MNMIAKLGSIFETMTNASYARGANLALIYVTESTPQTANQNCPNG